MAKLNHKVQNALNEARILVLGTQVLLGFEFRSFLEKGFEGLPFSSQVINLSSLWLLLLTIALLISPTAHHRIVEQGEDTQEIHRYTSKVMLWALLPLALALGLDLFVAANKIAGFMAGVAAAALSLAAALFFWYGLEWYRRREREPAVAEAKMETQGEGKKGGASDVHDRISHVLTETRMILPGAQALLGFQLAATLMEGFDGLPAASKYVHLASLALIALTIILLMTPAAYHRIVERGEETEHFHRFASRMIVAALVPLALGLAAAVYVAVRKVLDSQLVAVVGALVALALFWELWFGLTLYRRTQRKYSA